MALTHKAQAQSDDQATVSIECESCQGSGICKESRLPTGVGIVCQTCKGKGELQIPYKPFTGRKVLVGIRVVRRLPSARYMLTTGPDTEVSYEDFLSGKMPK